MNAHSKQRYTSPLRLTLAGAGVVGVIGALGITYAVGHRASASATTTSKPGATKPHQGTSSTTAASTTTVAPTTTLPPTLPSVTKITPAAGATNIAANAAITIDFSAPVKSGAPEPTISPAALGKWTTSGSTMTFTPTEGWVPFSTVSVSVPGTQPATASFAVAAGDPLRVQQLLAILGYLPLTFVPSGETPTAVLDQQPTVINQISTVPVAGNFNWNYANTPASLVSLWNPNANTVITKGAIMAFESDHGLESDGTAGAGVWAQLLLAVSTHAPASHAYSYLMVSKVEPEGLQVWSQGAIVATTVVNTGAPGADTEDGTFPVFEHLASTTMIGTNPNGTKYDDPGVKYVAYFNGGDAVHEFYRYSYGWPQSNGCVELPSTSAAGVWGYDPIGTLVTVTGPTA